MRGLIESINGRETKTVSRTLTLAAAIDRFLTVNLRMKLAVSARMIDLVGTTIYDFVDAADSGKPFRAFRLCIVDGAHFTWTNPVTEDIDPIADFYDLITFEPQVKLEKPPICTVSIDIAALYAQERANDSDL